MDDPSPPRRDDAFLAVPDPRRRSRERQFRRFILFMLEGWWIPTFLVFALVGALLMLLLMFEPLP